MKKKTGRIEKNLQLDFVLQRKDENNREELWFPNR